MDIKNITQAYSQFSEKVQEGFDKIQSLIQELEEEAQKGNDKAQQWSQQLQEISDSFKSGHDKIGNIFERIGSFLAKGKNSSGSEDREKSGSGLSDLLQSFLSSNAQKSEKGSSASSPVANFLDKILKK